MQNAIVTIVLALSLAQPKLRPATEPPRYVPIPLPDNAEQILKSIQLDSGAFTPQMTKDMTDRIAKIFEGPEGKQKLKERVEKIMTDYIAAHPKEANANNFDIKEISKFAKQELARDPLGKNPLPQPPIDAPVPAPPAPKPQTLDQRVGRWLAEWLQNEETGGRLVEFMRDSPAFKDALEDLLRSVNEVDAGWQPNLPDVPGGFEPPRLPGLGEFPKIGLPDLSNAGGWLPKLPRLQMPAFSMPQLPDFSGPHLPDVGGDWPQMVIAVLLVAGLLIGIRMWALKTPAPASRALLALPATITTREELRRAFEALALNRFGDEARPWNHRLVGHRLGGSPAAEELTRLYEQGRYAPGDGPLSAGDRASADRSLAELAGETS